MIVKIYKNTRAVRPGYWRKSRTAWELSQLISGAEPIKGREKKFGVLDKKEKEKQTQKNKQSAFNRTDKERDVVAGFDEQTNELCNQGTAGSRTFASHAVHAHHARVHAHHTRIQHTYAYIAHAAAHHPHTAPHLGAGKDFKRPGSRRLQALRQTGRECLNALCNH